MPKTISLENLEYFKQMQENTLFKKMTKVNSINLLNPTSIFEGRIPPNGKIDHLTDYFHTSKIQAIKGDVFSFFRKANNNSVAQRNGSFTFYDNENNIIASGSSTTLTTTMTVPDDENIAYCVFNFQTNISAENTMIVKNAIETPILFEEYSLPYYVMGEDFAQPFLNNEIRKNITEYKIGFNVQTRWSLIWYASNSFDLRIVLPKGSFYVVENNGKQILFNHASDETFELSSFKMLVFNKLANTFRIVDYPSGNIDLTSDIPMVMKLGLTLMPFAFDLENENNIYQDGFIGYENTILGGINIEEKYELNYAWSDFCIVHNKLCVFVEGSDNHQTLDGWIHIYDFNNGSLIEKKVISHNLGHCNTVSYCEQTDTLILGNGGSISNVENNQIMIIKNFNTLIENSEKTQIDYHSDCLVIDIVLAGLDWGVKLNVCWGESNLGNYDIAYCLLESADEKTKFVKKIQLGKGTNKLQYGTLQNVGENDFNGTFRIMFNYQDLMSTTIVNNGTKYYNGKLYEMIGHTGLWISVSELKYQYTGSYKLNRKYLLEKWFKPDGSEQPINGEGIEIADGKIYLGGYHNSIGGVIFVGRFENIL